MGTTKDLYHLIQGLSKQEKRYFKVFAKKHHQTQNQDYLLLYNKFKELTAPNEEQLKKKLAQHPQLLKKLSVTKNYLYQALLDSLTNFHKDKTVEQQLHQMLEAIPVLFEKDLNDQALQILKKARHSAETYEMQEFLLMINEWEHTIHRKRRDTRALNDYFQSMYPQQKQLLTILDNRLTLRKLESEIFVLKENWNYIRNEQEEAVFEKIMGQQLLQDENQALSFEAKKSFYNIHKIYERVKGQLQTSYETGQKIVNLFDQYPQQKAVRPNHYLASVGNLLGIQKELGLYEECFQTLSRLEEVKGQSRILDKEVFLLEYQVRLIIYVDCGLYKQGIQLQNPILKGLDEYEGLIRKDWILDFYHDQALLHLMAGSTSKSLYWINQMLNNIPQNAMLQKHSYGRLLDLMIRYEAGDKLYLPNAIRSTYRFLIGRDRLYDFEKLVLKFLKGLPNIKTQKAYKKHLSWLQTALNELSSDPNEYRVMNYLKFQDWVESKLNSIAFADAIQNKANFSEEAANDRVFSPQAKE